MELTVTKKEGHTFTSFSRESTAMCVYNWYFVNENPIMMVSTSNMFQQSFAKAGRHEISKFDGDIAF